MPTLTEPRPLTPKQRAVYEFVWRFTLRHGYQPDYRTVMSEFGFTSPNALFGFLTALAKKGYVEQAGRASALRFLVAPDGTPFRGLAPAGEPDGGPAVPTDLTARASDGGA